MEPQIQYAKTSDGVNIAYATFGQGPPIVFASSLFGGLHMASYSSWMSLLIDQLAASGWQVILYDSRGAGSSDRNATDFTLDARVSDLEAVVDSANLGPCVLVASADGGPYAIAYAAKYPDRVAHLVLRNAFSSGMDRDQAMLAMIVARALRPVAEEHWGFFVLTLANALFGYTNSDQARQSAEGYESGLSPQAYLSMTRELDRVDTSNLLVSLKVPTLVLNDRTFMTTGAGWGEVARNLASRIPNARLVATDDFPRALADVLREHVDPNATMESGKIPAGTAIILFADIADSTALTERLGDAAFREKARELDEALRRAISSNGGTAIDGKLLGDGVLATFGAAREAIACAQEMHQLAGAQSSPPPVGEEPALSLSKGLGEGSALLLHVGIHAGDVIREANNVYGGAVNIAARVASEAAAGETLVSGTVRDLARTSAGVSFEDRGERELKGVGEPVRVFAVRSGDAPLPFREGAGG